MPSVTPTTIMIVRTYAPRFSGSCAVIDLNSIGRISGSVSSTTVMIACT